MTTHHLTDGKIALRDPVEFAASIPYLLGFTPTRSLVLGFADQGGTHLMCARIDLAANAPGAVDGQPIFAEAVYDVCVRACQRDARYVAAVLYPGDDEHDVGWSSEVVRQASARTSLELLHVASVVGSLWSDRPDGGNETIDLTSAALRVNAEWVASGASFVNSRQELAARVVGPPTPITHQLAELLSGDVSRWEHQLTGNASARRAMENEIVSYLFSFGAQRGSDIADGPSAPPAARILAQWVIGLADSRIREPVLWRLAERYEFGIRPSDASQRLRTLDTWCLLVREVPHAYSASISSCAAAFAWQVGNGALADILATHALQADPRSVLSSLVQQATRQGVHPETWINMLQSLRVSQLRAGHRGRRFLDTVQPLSGIADRPLSHGDDSSQVRDCPG